MLGLPADRNASVADEMFLPILLRDNFAGTVIVHDGIEESLAEPLETVVDIPATQTASKAWVPQALFWLIFAFVVLVTFVFKRPGLEKVIDYILYFIFSVIALLLIFTNIFSEHDALHLNLLFLGINVLIALFFI